MVSKSRQSAEKVLVQQSASTYRDPGEAHPAPSAVRERRSIGSQQQRPQGRESTAAADKDKQSVATSKTESKLFLVSASTASVMGSASAAPGLVPDPVAGTAGPKPSGKASAASGVGSLTRCARKRHY